MTKPQPYSKTELSTLAVSTLTAVSINPAPITGRIDLYEAMTRALKYNLDRRVKTAEIALSRADLRLSHHSLLPEITANAGYSGRNNYLASSSLNLDTYTQNFGASTSSEKRLRTADITFSWNILDFGLSYIRARQASDKLLISRELERKAVQNLLEEVRSAYWRAVSYEHLVGQLKQLDRRTLQAISESRALSRSGVTDRLAALNSERELLEIRNTISELEADNLVAKAELAALMSLPPGTPFELADAAQPAIPEELPYSLDEMLLLALRDRPEVRENLYQQRINMRESHAALIEILPGLEVFASGNWDSNAFLLNNNWVGWGTAVSWSLVKAFRYPAKKRVVKSQAQVLDARANALAMTIMTQVHLSQIRFEFSHREFDNAREFRSVQKRILRQVQKEAQASIASKLTLLREELNMLVANARYDIAYADLQGAYGQVFTSIGRDLYGAIDERQNVDALADSLRNEWLNKGIAAAAPQQSSNGEGASPSKEPAKETAGGETARAETSPAKASKQGRPG